MRNAVKLWGLALLGVTLPGPRAAHGQTVNRADVIGTWRRVFVNYVVWDSTEGLVVVPAERLLTLRADGTFATHSQHIQNGKPMPDAWGLLLGNHDLGTRGQWSLAGDTLVVDYLPSDTLEAHLENTRWDSVRSVQVGDTVWGKRRSFPLPRYKLARAGTKLTVEELADVKRFPQEFERVDTTKPLPALVPPPVTLNRTDLVGTWATATDTLTLRADSTWTGSPIVIGRFSEPKSGKWYLAPGNVVALFGEHQELSTTAVGRWRGGEVRLQGQQLIVGPPYNLYLTYERIGNAAP